MGSMFVVRIQILVQLLRLRLQLLAHQAMVEGEMIEIIHPKKLMMDTVEVVKTMMMTAVRNKMEVMVQMTEEMDRVEMVEMMITLFVSEIAMLPSLNQAVEEETFMALECEFKITRRGNHSLENGLISAPSSRSRSHPPDTEQQKR